MVKVVTVPPEPCKRRAGCLVFSDEPPLRVQRPTPRPRPNQKPINILQIPEGLLPLLVKKMPAIAMKNSLLTCRLFNQFVDQIDGKHNITSHHLCLNVYDRDSEERRIYAELKKWDDKHGRLETVAIIKDLATFLEDAKLFKFPYIRIGFAYDSEIPSRYAVRLLRDALTGVKLHCNELSLWNVNPEIFDYIIRSITATEFHSGCTKEVKTYKLMQVPGAANFEEVTLEMPDLSLDGHYEKFKDFKKLNIHGFYSNFGGSAFDVLIREARRYPTAQYRLKHYHLGCWDDRSRTVSQIRDVALITEQGYLDEWRFQDRIFITDTRLGFILIYTPYHGSFGQRSLMFVDDLEEAYIEIFHLLTENRLHRVAIDFSVYYDSFIRTNIQDLSGLFEDILRPYPYVKRRRIRGN